MLSRYAWIITAQQQGDPDTDPLTPCGVTGPSDAPAELLAKVRGTVPPLGPESRADLRRFQLRNGDGELDAEGVIAGDFYGFEPLDDIGEGNYGSASIWFQDARPGAHFGCWYQL